MPGPHILQKIALGHSSGLNCGWRVPIKVLADICEPGRQGCLEQLRLINPHYHRYAQAKSLGSRLGIHPQYISAVCGAVQQLAGWEDHPQFQHLVHTDAGHCELNGCANAYRCIHKFWPSPELVFETLLGSPSSVATADAAEPAAAKRRRR